MSDFDIYNVKKIKQTTSEKRNIKNREIKCHR